MFYFYCIFVRILSASKCIRAMHVNQYVQVIQYINPVAVAFCRLYILSPANRVTNLQEA